MNKTMELYMELQTRREGKIQALALEPLETREEVNRREDALYRAFNLAPSKE